MSFTSDDGGGGGGGIGLVGCAVLGGSDLTSSPLPVAAPAAASAAAAAAAIPSAAPAQQCSLSPSRFPPVMHISKTGAEGDYGRTNVRARD